MAVQQNIELQNGLIVNDAYVRIDTVAGYKGAITISVNSYVSQQDFLDGKPYLEQRFYTFTPDVSPTAKEMWTQGYEYLKTLDEYAGAVDC